MNRDQRVARLIQLRQAHRHPPRRSVPPEVFTDLDAITAATTDPTIHAAVTRIRAALGQTKDPDRQPTEEST
ncbi:hypothetical protein J3A78_003843 [Streptomyces sp. PvR006]|uniref:hypothetical protein n=1 Tax=Streptomyces sp. PvR006 TaxID=2817860 RepID=UPI001AE26EDF|nr:hypothetical protein [Streptomyces sp. PvR006]MBP2583365.1 hypothetical protein [Streptomyces sp. PvR006]